MGSSSWGARFALLEHRLISSIAAPHQSLPSRHYPRPLRPTCRGLTHPLASPPPTTLPAPRYSCRMACDGDIGGVTGRVSE